MHIFFCQFKLHHKMEKKAGKVYFKLLSIESLLRDALNSVHFSNFKEYIYKFFERISLQNLRNVITLFWTTKIIVLTNLTQ